MSQNLHDRKPKNAPSSRAQNKRGIMKIAIASGKGGTGKTTLSTNLAYTLGQNGHWVTYVDCDVEEPNGHLFLKPAIVASRPVGLMVPKIDSSKWRHNISVTPTIIYKS